MDKHASNFEVSHNVTRHVQMGLLLNEGAHNGVIAFNTLRAERVAPFDDNIYKRTQGDAIAVYTSTVHSQNAGGHTSPATYHTMTYSGKNNPMGQRDWTGTVIANNLLLGLNGDVPWSNDSHVANDQPIPDELICGTAPCPVDPLKRLNLELRTAAEQNAYLFSGDLGDFRLKLNPNDPGTCLLRPGVGAIPCGESPSRGSTTQTQPMTVPVLP